MSLNDLLSDFVTRVRNAKMIGRSTLNVRKNNIVKNVCETLQKLGYIRSFSDGELELIVELNLSRINGLKRISKPGRRLYFSYKMLPVIRNGIGYNILSTSKGVKSNVDAKKDMLGGELLFQIW
jgi:small subunit ribosomal protein S8